ETKDLQLLRVVGTRWSSTLLMMDRAILLCAVCFVAPHSFPELNLHKYKLGEKEWEALAVFKRILDLPHAFQQKLSAEKTPTLGDALPAFEAMIKIWQRQQIQHPETAHIIQKGIDKLAAYQERVQNVPAYSFAMILNPATKLKWFEQHRPRRLKTFSCTRFVLPL
ncbi:hypothetical protein C8R44DRAFT_603285, partial [Mycena epipterygia]